MNLNVNIKDENLLPQSLILLLEEKGIITVGKLIVADINNLFHDDKIKKRTNAENLDYDKIDWIYGTKKM